MAPSELGTVQDAIGRLATCLSTWRGSPGSGPRRPAPRATRCPDARAAAPRCVGRGRRDALTVALARVWSSGLAWDLAPPGSGPAIMRAADGSTGGGRRSPVRTVVEGMQMRLGGRRDPSGMRAERASRPAPRRRRSTGAVRGRLSPLSVVSSASWMIGPRAHRGAHSWRPRRHRTPLGPDRRGPDAVGRASCPGYTRSQWNGSCSWTLTASSTGPISRSWRRRSRPARASSSTRRSVSGRSSCADSRTCSPTMSCAASTSVARSGPTASRTTRPRGARRPMTCATSSRSSARPCAHSGSRCTRWRATRPTTSSAP